MRKIQQVLLLTLGLLVCVAATAADKPTFTNPDKAIMVKPGAKNITLVLKSNPTTGYSWFYQSSEPAWLKVVSHQYIASKTKMMGAPGVEKWTFNVPNLSNSVPRVAMINMRYARPWDIKASKVTTFFVVFTGR
ncbi:MAG: protease inhibitor I42 family protein [Coxiellaceae bacterium]|nr:protease inhibitor I42 family protein [Coxiellaceae bacterium]